VDGKKGTVSVRQTIHASTSKGLYFADPKSKASIRTISVPRNIITAIEAHKLKCGTRDGLLFLNTRGNPINPNHYLQTNFKKIRKATGITKGFHTFRHTHATELLAAGIPIVDVSRRLGHSKVSVTLDVYGHQMPASDEKIIAAINTLWKEKNRTSGL
jgi:integrase